MDTNPQGWYVPFMRAEELLESLTDDELKKKADACFAEADSMQVYLQSGDSKLYLPEGATERQRLLAEADFYLKALAWRSDARTAQRDFWMEVGVMVLIGAEIVLSWTALREGSKQSQILADMDSSTAATASAMAAVSKSLQSLADAQAKSLDRLNQMSDTLRESLKTNSAMAGATHKQLDILQQEQADHAAQLAKKPKLQLYIGSVPVITGTFNALRPPAYPIREQTDTSMTFDSSILNQGKASATRVQVRVVINAKDVSFSVPGNVTRANEPPDNPFQTWLINIDLIRPNVNIPMTLTFSFPKGHAPFEVAVNVDADELETGTPLGNFTLVPRKPANEK